MDLDGDGTDDRKDDSDGDGMYDWQDSDSDGNGIDDFVEMFDREGESDYPYMDLITDGDVADKEAVDAPDAFGAAVSGPALGGAAVGAGAVAGEAGGLDEDLFDEVQDFFGDMFGGGEAPAGAGAVDQAIDAGTEWAGGAIDDALGIEGSGKVLENVANGNFDEALGTVTDSAGNYVGEWLDNEDLGDTFGEAFNHVANGDFEEAFDTAVDGVGEALEDFGEDILGGIGGLFD